MTYPGTVVIIPELMNQYSGEYYHGAEQCAEQLVTLPVHSLLSSSDTDRIRKMVFTCFGSEGLD